VFLIRGVLTTRYCFVIKPEKRGAEQDAESSSSQSCFVAMKTCLDKFISADRILLERLNAHCRLYWTPW